MSAADHYSSAVEARRRPATGSRIRTALIGVGLFFYTWGFIEVFLRVFDPQPPMPRYLTGTPWGVRGNIPNAHYRHRTPEVDVEYRINSQGMRADRAYPLTKPSGTCRIALLGDSAFFGYEANLEDTFGYRLEKRLNDDGVRAEVLNFGVSGFGTAEMIKTYAGFGRRFDPDMVILEWHESDPDDNVHSGFYAVADGALVPAAKTYLPAIRAQDVLMKWALYRFFISNSHLYEFLREDVPKAGSGLLLRVQRRIDHMRGKADAQNTAQVPPGEPDPKLNEEYETTLAGLLVKYAKATVSRDNRDFLVVEMPRRITRTRFDSALDLLPADVRNDPSILSPIDALHAAADPNVKLYYEKGWGHMTPKGIEVVVNAVYPRVEQSRWLDGCRTPPGVASPSR